MVGPTFIEGERVTLRPVERDDADFLQRGWSDPAVRTQIGVGRPRNRAQIESHIEGYVEDGGGAALLVCLDDDPVGEVTVKDLDSNRPELTCWIAPEYHGEGYGSEANALFIDYIFDTFEIRGLRARAFSSNAPSCTVLEKLGFTQEGTLRDHRFLDGEYEDVVLYGLLREEWANEHVLSPSGRR